MGKNLLGVDFGTTALKACLFDENGNCLASESAQYKLITEGQFIEFDAEEFEKALEEVCYDGIAAGVKKSRKGLKK